MAKPAAGLPSVARPKHAAKATPVRLTTASKTTLNPIVNGTVTPVTAGGSAKSTRGPANKPLARTSPIDDAPTDLLVIFGANLRAARLKCGFNQREVAALSGLPQQYLSQIEMGQQNITLRTIEALAKVVDHDVSTLLRRAVCPPEKK